MDCPKCKSKNSLVTEVLLESTEYWSFDIKDGNMNTVSLIERGGGDVICNGDISCHNCDADFELSELAT